MHCPRCGYDVLEVTTLEHLGTTIKVYKCIKCNFITVPPQDEDYNYDWFSGLIKRIEDVNEYKKG